MYNQAKNPGKVQKIIRIMYFIELLESNDSIYKIEIVLNFKKQSMYEVRSTKNANISIKYERIKLQK